MKIIKDNIATRDDSKIGVFLCECGGRISSKIHLEALKSRIADDFNVSHVEIMPYPCLGPGLGLLKARIAEKSLNRIVIAGCEYRIMLKKLEAELEPVGVEKGAIDVVNIRDYVAAVGDGDASRLAGKSAKLINSAIEGLKALNPSAKSRVEINGPVMVLGGGIATYSSAQELIRQGVETIIAVHTDDIDDEIRMLHERYPGEREYHERLMAIMQEVDESPLVKRITMGELKSVLGVVGNYSVTFTTDDERMPKTFKAGAIIAALDGEMLNQGSDFGHDGKRVICHAEMEEYLWLHGAPGHRIVFWINDLETDRPYAYLSSKTAWNMAKYIRKNNLNARLSIVYNNRIKIPLSATERKESRELDIQWIAYDGRVRPTVQNGFLTYYDPENHLEREIPWDQLVLSPHRHPGHEQIKVAEILGLNVQQNAFLERNPQMVRPEQVGLDEKILVGSARQPCDLREALRQGRRAGKKAAEIVQQAKEGKLFAPRIVCAVDQEKCTGCGLCREICDCGGISPVEGPGGNIPRVVDPMVCTGGGTCAAACPHQALYLQNNTTEQREARVAGLAELLAPGEVMGIGCNWGGAAAADHAGLRSLAYDERFYLLPVGCIGQLDPTVLGRAFLEGANGLLLMGCPPEECHHSYGIDHTWSRVLLIKKLLSHIGVERERIALAHTDLNQPEEFVKTVNRFVKEMELLGPIDRDEKMTAKIKALYDTLRNPRVRWVLGASLRRPWETTYPTDQRNALAYDATLSDVLAEEFIRSRVINLLREKGRGAVLNLVDIADSLGEEKQKLLGCLGELAREGSVSRVYKNRTPYYTAW